MTIFLLLLGLVCLWNIKFVKIRGDYLSIDRTNSIKGIFIILVFFSHIVNGYVSFDGIFDAPYMAIRRVLGQSIVSMFLFYSGYGNYQKITTREGYCQTIPTRRIATTLIKFDIAILLFAIYRYMTGTVYSVKKMVLTFLGWEGIGNSNWYIFCILWLYLFTYIAFSVFRNTKSAIYAMTLLVLAYIGVVSKYKGDAHWWYDTALCYVLGMIYAKFQYKIESVIDENFKTWIFSFIIMIVLYLASYLHKDNGLIYEFMIFAFTFGVAIFTMHIEINNKILEWFGKNLFEIFILQRIPMIIFKDIGLASWNRYVYVVVCFITTIVLAIVFKSLISKNINLGRK